MTKKVDGRIGIAGGDFFRFRAKGIDLKVDYDKINLLLSSFNRVPVQTQSSKPDNSWASLLGAAGGSALGLH